MLFEAVCGRWDKYTDCGILHWIIRKVGVTRHGFHIVVAEQFSDDGQIIVSQKISACKLMAQILQSKFGHPSHITHFVSYLLRILGGKSWSNKK